MKNKEYYIRLGEAVQKLEEKNCPTDPSKWSYYKSQAKEKFDVYPSAYANGWASKQYGDAGGSWKKCASEATDAQETEFHTQLDKLVHKTFGKSPEEKMNEKFDKTHLGILQYAFKDIDRINPSEPAYKRLVDMLNKLSKQELQQIASVDIKFLSLLAKNLLSKKESVNEAGYTVKAKNPYQFLNGVVAVLGAYLRDEELGPKGKRELQNILKSLEYMRMYFYANMSESVNESHFQVGDKVKMSHGGVGVVKSLDKEDGGDDEKYYNIELPNGEIMKHAPNELTLAETDLNESSMSNIDIIAQEAKDFKDFVKEFYNEYKDFPKDRDTIKWLKGVYDNRSTNEAELPNAVIPSSVKVKLTQAIDKIKDSNLTYNQKLQVIGKIIDGLGVDKKELAKISTRIKSTLESVVNEGNSSVEIGDIIFFPPANSAATVIDRFGRSVTLKLANGKKVKTVVDKVKLLAQDNVNEGNAFTGALFKARKEGLTEFEFNGKKYPVHKLEEEEKEETLVESKLTKNSLKQIIKEEYHNVKTFMEEKYGFTPELGKVYSNLAAKPFLKEEEEEVIEEYDVENYEDLKEFVQFMAEYKSDINEAEYQGRKVKLGKIMQGDVKKFKVYVKNDKGNVVKVNFGQGGDAKGGTMRIRKDNPEARASFRARHNCDTPGPRWKARYWSCRKW